MATAITDSNLIWHEWPDFIKEPTLVKHNVYIHDFVMIANHDVPCYVCWNNPAMFTRNMTPGEYKESWQPCTDCQEKGWQLKKKVSLIKKLIKFFSFY